jgi:membrane-bound lytic murein transglycosylase D
MKKFRKRLFITIAVVFLPLLPGCAQKSITKTHVETKQPRKVAEETLNPAYQLLQAAEEAYAKGVAHNMRRDWIRAVEDFDEALRIIAQVDVSDEPDISTRTDLLLREIAYDYRFALAHSESLSVTAAPIVLSVALEDRAMSEDTRRRLAELAGQLPKAISGEFDFPVVWNDRGKEKIIYFQTNLRDPFTLWLSRSSRYKPMIDEIFREKELPLDLGYLPLVESGFEPRAYSWAHAMGLWQFIKSTGKIFKLEVNWWIDERRDPEKATIAAADYFRSLYRKFGNWELCLAAYNCGDGRVGRSLKSQEVESYWDLTLPTETMNYVPLFMAALIIAKNPQIYGFQIDYAKPYEFEYIEVNQPTNLDLIAQCTDTSLNYIQELNPEILRYCTPPDVTNYRVRVPAGKADGFAARYALIPQEEKTVWARHKVKKGETLSEIAYHYGTSVAMLVESNRLPSAHKLSIGQELVIPVSSATAKELAAKGATPIPATPASTSKAPTSRYYTVKKNDTLSKIAESHNVSLEDLLLANDLGRGSIIKPGMRLTIPIGMAQTEYVVQSGDTPSTIAARFGVSTSDLLAWNKLDETSTIYPGQKLTLLAAESQQKPMGKIVHTVQKGESLWSIARRYNVHVSDLITWNGLTNNSTLQVGQKLQIIGETAAGTGGYTQNRSKITYTVQKGDNLGKIAEAYEVTVEAIQRWNDKTDTRLQIGDKLTIYTDKVSSSQSTRQVVEHKVKSGETLSQIAEKYGTTVAEIKLANGKSSDAIRIGEVLKINSTVTKSDPVVIHEVIAGENLGSIARRYNVSVSDIKSWNSKSSDKIVPGEKLTIKGVQSTPAVAKPQMVRHEVSSGETLSGIAVRYGVSTADIKKWNNKKTDLVYVGEVLTIHSVNSSRGFESKPEPIVHTVANGETLWAIARKHGTTTDRILRDNPNIDPKLLKIGDILLVNPETN